MLKRVSEIALVLTLAIILASVCIVGYIDVTTARFIYGEDTIPPKTEVALVLGASVASNGRLSPVMKERADAAAELYKNGTVAKLLVTGDNATLAYNEVYPVGKYLLALGIPQDDIFLDYAGFDTYSSMYRARDVFNVTSALVVSQGFHLPRAVFIARALGLNAYGVDAAQEDERFFMYSVREIPASLKAAVEVWVGRTPKYLGPGIPVSGSSANTWVGTSTQMIYWKRG